MHTSTRCCGFMGNSEIQHYLPVSCISEKARLQIHVTTFWGLPELEIRWQYVESGLTVEVEKAGLQWPRLFSLAIE